MKAYLALAGTVILGAAGGSGKERLNLQQVMIVTPRTAEAMGLSYENLWKALSETKSELVHGSPILVKITNQPDLPPAASLSGPVVSLALDKAAIAIDKNAFIRT